MKTVHLIINPNAGTRQARRFLPEMISVFNRAAYFCSVYITARRGDAVAFTVSGINATGHPLAVRFTMDGKVFATATAEAGRFQVSANWNVPQNDDQSFHAFTAELLDGETAIDILENGISVWSQDALAKGLKKIVFDRSGYIYHGRVKALAEAAREAGLEF